MLNEETCGRHYSYTVDEPTISEEEPIESQPMMMAMFDKLTKAVNNLESEVNKEKSLKLPGIDLMLRIQAAQDECGSFPENSTVNILAGSQVTMQLSATHTP